jgi:hypothetical protein
MWSYEMNKLNPFLGNVKLTEEIATLSEELKNLMFKESIFV